MGIIPGKHASRIAERNATGYDPRCTVCDIFVCTQSRSRWIETVYNTSDQELRECFEEPYCMAQPSTRVCLSVPPSSAESSHDELKITSDIQANRPVSRFSASSVQEEGMVIA